MTDVGHELGAIRHIVDTPLSSKVAMFNKVASQHNASQLLNPFSNVDGGRGSPKPIFSKDEYGKPIAGSMTEMRGQKANIHVCKEMLELCQIIDGEGFTDDENPDLKIIYFGDLFNIYNHISDKVVGLLLRARKHKLLDFEGEMLFQRRDDEVPIFMLKPIKEIRAIMEAKQEEFRRSVSPAPQPTSVLQDKMKQRSVSPQPKKCMSKSPSPSPNRGSKKGLTKENSAPPTTTAATTTALLSPESANAPVAVPVPATPTSAPTLATTEIQITSPTNVTTEILSNNNNNHNSSSSSSAAAAAAAAESAATKLSSNNPIITHITDPEEVQRFLDDLAKNDSEIETISIQEIEIVQPIPTIVNQNNNNSNNTNNNNGEDITQQSNITVTNPTELISPSIPIVSSSSQPEIQSSPTVTHDTPIITNSSTAIETVNNILENSITDDPIPSTTITESKEEQNLSPESVNVSDESQVQLPSSSSSPTETQILLPNEVPTQPSEMSVNNLLANENTSNTSNTSIEAVDSKKQVPLSDVVDHQHVIKNLKSDISIDVIELPPTPPPTTTPNSNINDKQEQEMAPPPTLLPNSQSDTNLNVVNSLVDSNSDQTNENGVEIPPAGSSSSIDDGPRDIVELIQEITPQ